MKWNEPMKKAPKGVQPVTKGGKIIKDTHVVKEFMSSQHGLKSTAPNQAVAGTKQNQHNVFKHAKSKGLVP